MNKTQTDDDYLIKLKYAKFSDVLIAVKLGWSVNQVRERWKVLESTMEAMVSNGYQELTKAYNLLALQYQLMGQSLAQVAVALDKPVLAPELADLIRAGGDSPEKIAENLLKKVIVLRPFVLTPPQQLFQMAEGG